MKSSTKGCYKNKKKWLFSFASSLKFLKLIFLVWASLGSLIYNDTILDDGSSFCFLNKALADVRIA